MIYLSSPEDQINNTAMASAIGFGILSLILKLHGLSACVPTSLDPGSVQIIISSHDGLYQEGDIHTRNCSEDTGGRRYIGWCPDPHDESPSYVEIHLQSPKAVHALQFQSTYSGCPDPRHHYDTEAFLATFDLQFVIVGDVERNWVTYDENLPALDGTGPERKYVFADPLVTSSLKIIPKMHNIYSCFRLAVSACEPTDLCPKNWCLNGGQCSGENLCTCSQGYYGNRCNDSINNLVPENYDFTEIKDNKLETPDATFDVTGNVTLESYRKRDSHHHHHGHAIHCNGHHSYVQYSSGHYHHGRRRDSHHHSRHSSCMSNLGHSSHGFTTSMNVHFDHHHDHHKPHCVFSNGGSLPGHQGASLHYHNHHLHFSVHSASHSWTISAPHQMPSNQWHHIQCSWHPKHGVSVHVNNHHVGSSCHARPHPHQYTQTVPLRLCHNHHTDVTINIQISGLNMYPVSQQQLTTAGIKAPYTPPPPTTPTTTPPSTTTPTPASATTTPPATTLPPTTPTTTSGPHRPMCYNCSSQASLGSCQTKALCQVGEVCSVFQDKNGYTSKCMDKKLCNDGKAVASSSCWECCESYLCNEHCSASTTVNCADKSSCATLMATGYDVCKTPKVAVDICRKTCNKC